MTLPSLKDAHDKLARANYHFEVLRREIEPFEQRDTHTFSVEIDAQTGEYAFYVHGLEEIPEAGWGLVVGDCAHNARTALDYLVVRLAALVTGRGPADIGGIQFPVCDTREKFEGAKALADLRKHPVFRQYWARIEQLQPYNRDNAAVWGVRWFGETPIPVAHALPVALEQLATLDNIDKHRVVHAVWSGIDQWQTLGQKPDVPGGFVFLETTPYWEPLEDGACVGKWRFKSPLPREWKPSQVEMKRYFPLRVALGDVPTAQRVLEVLDLCLWGAWSVLRIFQPVFDGVQPPLAPTAIENVFRPRGELAPKPSP